MSMGKGDMKPPGESCGPLSSLTVSWKTGGSFSSLTDPSNLIKGDYGHNGINGTNEGRDINKLSSEDVEPCHGEG